jgi:hypothetical protein
VLQGYGKGTMGVLLEYVEGKGWGTLWYSPVRSQAVTEVDGFGAECRCAVLTPAGAVLRCTHGYASRGLETHGE